ncbi:MAG: hypothetical protein QN168_02035 [Armatimonadota bacterium]|nr:hypothetical protein [Armatimonadota bacterium]
MLVRHTCRWLIQQGVEAVGPAKALLVAKAGSLADRIGDPQGLLQPVGSPARVQKAPAGIRWIGSMDRSIQTSHVHRCRRYVARLKVIDPSAR